MEIVLAKCRRSRRRRRRRREEAVAVTVTSPRLWMSCEVCGVFPSRWRVI
jgi:hypothetical protein